MAQLLLTLVLFTVNFYKRHIRQRTQRGTRLGAEGFTLVEAVVAISLIGIGVAVTLGALTKFNSDAAASRNATGAEALLLNQIDLFESMSPFNPQRTPPQVPVAADGTYDMSVGTHTIAYKDPTTGVVSTQTDPWPVYREPARWTYANAAARTSATGFTASDVGCLAFQRDTETYWMLQSTTPTWSADTTGGIIVKGTMTCTVTNISTVDMPNTYKAVFTLGYTFGSRNGGKGGPIFNATRNRWEFQMSMSTIRTSDI